MKIKYRKLKGYKYQTVEQAAFQTDIYPQNDIAAAYIKIEKNGKLTIDPDYCWDGPSGPTIDGKTNIRASLAHDALYQLIRLGLLPENYRKSCDLFFIQICKEDGMWGFRRWLDFTGLRWFAGNAATPRMEVEPQDQIYTAP